MNTLAQELHSRYGHSIAELERVLIEIDKQVGFWILKAEPWLERSEAEATANLAMLEGLEAYQDGLGASLRHFVKLRARWALLDHLRAVNRFRVADIDLSTEYPCMGMEYVEICRINSALRAKNHDKQGLLYGMIVGEDYTELSERYGVDKVSMYSRLVRFRRRLRGTKKSIPKQP